MKARMLSLVILSALFSGCLGPAMINKWVDNRYGTLNAGLPKAKEDFISVTSPLIIANLKSSTTKKEVKKFLPLLLYWQYDYRNTCTLNPKIPIAAFRTAVLAYAKTKGLRQRLNGQQIQISVAQLPHVFVVNDRAHLIIPFVSWEVIQFRPQMQDLVVNYTVTAASGQSKTGTITVPNIEKSRTLLPFQPIKKVANLYFDQYNAALKTMSQAMMDQLVAEVAPEVAKL